MQLIDYLILPFKTMHYNCFVVSGGSDSDGDDVAFADKNLPTFKAISSRVMLD